MNRLFIAAAACAVCLGAHAEGYQVNTFSTRQQGMGHVGVAMKLGSESLIFNPGATTFMGKTMEVSGSLSAISSHVDCTHNGSVYETDNKTSTPMNISAAFRIYDNLYAGVSFYTPYGSSINWGYNWPGAALNQAVDLKVFTVQPTISWRVLPKLSIGAGLMISWGKVDLNKGLVSTSSLNKSIALTAAGQTLQGAIAQGVAPAEAYAMAIQAYGKAPQLPENISPARANLVGTAETTVGFNIGAMYEISEQWTVGASFRSKMNMHVKAGDVSVNYANDVAQQVLESELKNLNYTNFDASMPCPYVLTAGVSFNPTKKLTLATDVQLNGWSAYKNLEISFAEQEGFNQNLKKDYHNAMTYHIGAQYATTERLDLRAGLMIDTSPCNTDYYNPETPGTTKVEPSVGLSFRPVKGLSIDLAFMYVWGAKVNGATGQFDDFIAKKYNEALSNAALQPIIKQYDLKALPEAGTFKADYKLHALIPALGVSYSF